MINAKTKSLFDWFSAEFPRFDLMLSDAPNGLRIIIETADSGRNYRDEKALLIGRDYLPESDVYDVARAHIPAIVAGLYKKMDGGL